MALERAWQGSGKSFSDQSPERELSEESVSFGVCRPVDKFASGVHPRTDTGRLPLHVEGPDISRQWDAHRDRRRGEPVQVRFVASWRSSLSAYPRDNEGKLF